MAKNTQINSMIKLSPFRVKYKDQEYPLIDSADALYAAHHIAKDYQPSKPFRVSKRECIDAAKKEWDWLGEVENSMKSHPCFSIRLAYEKGWCL